MTNISAISFTDQVFIPFNPANDPEYLINAIISPQAALELVSGSANFTGGDGQASQYNGSLTALEIGAGILLTSGTGEPSLTNTSSNFSVSQLGNTDPDLQAVADAAFSGAGTVKDANLLEFEFDISDPSVQSITFDLVFGSDEFPEFSNTSFVDAASVFINGQNYALFQQSAKPLSVIDENLNLGEFKDNTSNNLPIEYDGISSVLTIVAPVVQGRNIIKFGVADTGDQIYDSGLFIANLETNSIFTDGTNSGVLINNPGTDGDDELTGSDNDEFFEGGAGDDSISGTGGNDVVDGGDGNDAINGGTGNDILVGGADSDIIEGGLGIDTLTGSEGADTFLGTLIELNEDTIIDFDSDDKITVINSVFVRQNLTVTFGSAILDIDENSDSVSDGTLTLEGSFIEGEFIVEPDPENPDNTIIRFIENTLGENEVLGTEANDEMFGLDGTDILFGLQGNDNLDARENNDWVNGNQDFDTVNGGSGQDTLYGGKGDDSVTGGSESDILSGDNGNDILVGVDPNQTNPGTDEIDTLAGGSGSDTFVLGDELQVYYDDNDSTTPGVIDYALITDFDQVDDTIQLRGSASEYRLETVTENLPEGTALYHNIDGNDELIAIIQATPLPNLESNSFVFV